MTSPAADVAATPSSVRGRDAEVDEYGSPPQAGPAIREMFVQFGPHYRWLVVLTTMSASITTLLAATMINVAIPEIMGAFGIGQDKAQWASSGFLAASTSAMLLNAWMVRSFGMRATYVFAMAIFLVGSVLGGLAWNPELLIVARVIQGAAAGLIQPLSMLVVFSVFPMSMRGAAMGIFSIGVVLAPALGPAVGGVIIDSLNWHYVLFFPLPFAMAVIPIGLLLMPRRDETGPRPDFDWVGFGLLVMFISMLLTGFANGERFGWGDNRIVAYLWTAAISATAFIFWETKQEHPLLDLRLFKIMGFTNGAIVVFVTGAGIYGSTYLVPLFLQTIQAYTPTDSGMLMIPAGLMMTIIFPFGGYLSDRVEARYPILIGLACFGISSLLLAGVDVNTGFWTMAWWVLIGRIGIGFIMPTANRAALQSLPPEFLSQGTGTMNFLMQLGGAFGVNLTAVALEIRTSVYADHIVATQTGAGPETWELIRGMSGVLDRLGMPEGVQLPLALQHLAQMIYAQANTFAFRDTFIMLAIVFMMALIPGWAMRQRHGHE